MLNQLPRTEVKRQTIELRLKHNRKMMELDRMKLDG